jgi:hypothetical protein
MHRTVAASASSIGKGGYVIDYAHGGWTRVCQIERLRPLFSQVDQWPQATAFIFSLLSGGFRFHLDITPFIAGAESSPQDEPD